MQTYDFTLRLNNDKHSLTAYNGIPATEIGKILIDLTDSLGQGHEIILSDIVAPQKAKYYFELGSLSGKITAIGNKGLEKRAYIRIDDENFDIEITPLQEKELLTHYKKTKLLLTIKKKIDFLSGSVFSATLEDYEVTPKKTFLKGLEELSKKHPNGLFSSENGGFVVGQRQHHHDGAFRAKAEIVLQQLVKASHQQSRAN